MIRVVRSPKGGRPARENSSNGSGGSGNQRTKAFANGDCRGAGGRDGYGSIASHVAVMVVPVWWPRDDSLAATQSGDDSNGEIHPKSGRQC